MRKKREVGLGEGEWFGDSLFIQKLTDNFFYFQAPEL